MKNVMTVNDTVLTIAVKELPFSEPFTQVEARIVQYEGVDEVLAYVKCTEEAREPGRMYACYYSMNGKLEGCNTIN